MAVDIGGTFTDVALEWPGGLTTAKCLTTPEAPEDGVIGGIATTLEDAGIDPGDIDLLIHGTTLATNTIIERKGAVCALVTTAGFRDIVETGYESRYDQYDLYLDKRAGRCWPAGSLPSAPTSRSSHSTWVAPPRRFA